MADETAASFKDEGNARFKEGQYSAAVEAYSRSLELDPKQHLCFSNRSAAYLKGGSAEKALEDAEQCLLLAPDWPKGYSRKAAALQEMKRWDDAIATCETGLIAAPEAALKKMLTEVLSRRFQDRLQGPWHGTVTESLGGYDQEMEFIDESSVRLEVLGRSITGRYWVDASVDPHHLTIQVPMQDMPPGMPPPPPVPYIARIDEKGLHMCCPFLTIERPTAFEGPGYCLMAKGSMAKGEDDEVSKLDPVERLLQCARDLIAALPNRKLEEVQQNDTEDDTRDKLMTQVKFESSMFAVQKRFGEEVMKQVLGAAKPASPSDVPPGLEATPELEELRAKLRSCGILDDEPVKASASSSSSFAPAVAKETKEAETASTSHRKAPESTKPSGIFLPLVISLTAVAAIAAFVWSSRRKR